MLVTGQDVWRISAVLCAKPWDFTVAVPAEEGATDAFRLVVDGPWWQMALAKRGRKTAPKGACTFLWKLNDGHAQCGLGDLRPGVCRAYPALLVNGTLCANSAACTCRRWSVLDFDGDTERALLEDVAREDAAYTAVVRRWNDGLDAARTYQDFGAYLLDVYGTAS